MQTNPHYFWFSFSLDGLNQGVCLIEDKHKEPGTERACHMAFQTATEKGLVPKHDHVQSFEVCGLENDLEANKLYSKADMDSRNYKSSNSKRDE
jgi:hypothetical protein